MAVRSSIDAILLLHHLPGVGPATFKRLLQRFRSVDAVLEQSIADLADYLNPAARSILQEYRSSKDNNVTRKLAYFRDVLQTMDVAVITQSDADYPSLLKNIPKAPPVLYVRGNRDVLHLPQLAMVGSRHATPSGLQNTQQFANYMSRSGFVITSGLALGIDAAAHMACINAGGKTIAVMGTGIDRIYPTRHAALADSILETGGALVSEFPIGTPAAASNFPLRNRIISGLSLGVLVVEAARKSGSLITATTALEQGREVFAIPGSIHNPLSRGCNMLIKNGATLVEDAEDIVDELSGMLGYKQAELFRVVEQTPTADALEKLSKDQQVLMLMMGFETVTLDQLAARTGMTAAKLSALMIELELKGKVARSESGYQRLA